MVSLKKQCLSEFLCGLLVGFFGLACLVPLKASGAGHLIDQYEFSMLFGLAIAFVVVIFNPISGAQFNPGVTLAMVLTKRQDKKTLAPYIGSQILGWFCGAALVYGVFATQIASDFFDDATRVSLLYCGFQGYYAVFPLEIILTAFIVILILACNDQRIVNKPGKALFPLVLALYITFAVSLGGPYSGACLNAARDFGPRLFAVIWGAANGYDVSGVFGAPCDFLIYLLIPTAGAVLGAFIYDGAIARLLPQPKVKVDVKGVINENYIKKGSVIKSHKKSK